MGCASSRVMHLQAERDESGEISKASKSKAAANPDGAGNATPKHPHQQRSRKRRHCDEHQTYRDLDEKHSVELVSSTYGVLDKRDGPLHRDKVRVLEQPSRTAARDRNVDAGVQHFEQNVDAEHHHGRNVDAARHHRDRLHQENADSSSSTSSSKKQLMISPLKSHRRSLSLSAVHAAQMVQSILMNNKDAAAGLQLLLKDMNSSTNPSITLLNRADYCWKSTNNRQDFVVLSLNSSEEQPPHGSSSDEKSSNASNSPPPKSSMAAESSTSPAAAMFDPELLEAIEKAFREIPEEEWKEQRDFLSIFDADRREDRPEDLFLSISDADRGENRREGDIFSTSNADRWEIPKDDRPKADRCDDRRISEADHCKIEEIAEEEALFDGFPKLCPPDDRDATKCVLYFTSLRGIRETFDDCEAVMKILHGYGVAVDERDVSMHLGFRQELQRLFAMDSPSSRRVPKVFIKGRFIGGAPEISRLHDNGTLSRMLRGIDREGPSRRICDGCGGARFIVCMDCSGSRKVRDSNTGSIAVADCIDCNENGLIRCPICC